MNNRDFLKEQRKYIETKKEALLGKKERQNNPRTPRYDPPPSGDKPIFVGFLALITIVILLLPLIVFFHSRTVTADLAQTELTAWIFATDEEYELIKNWLEPEILANNLAWQIRQGTVLQDLYNNRADLLIVEAEFAKELYSHQILVPLLEKRTEVTWDNVFLPFKNGDSKPFQKNFGWAIPHLGDVTSARHLFTVMQHFSRPFIFEQHPQ